MAPDQLQLVLPDLQYSTDYRFAIRALDKRDANIKGDQSSFAHASNWYGHGNGRQWQEWFGVSTRDRYETPFAVYADQSKTTETTMHICINSNIKDFLKAMEGADMEAVRHPGASWPRAAERPRHQHASVGRQRLDQLGRS